MKDALKIALGIFLGFVLISVCVAALFAVLLLGLNDAMKTPTAILTPSPGRLSQCGDFEISIARVDIVESCSPDNPGLSPPPKGKKFVALRVEEKSHTSGPLREPALQFSLLLRPLEFDDLEGADFCDPVVDPSDRDYPVCGDPLSPQAPCRRWVLFEVPKSMDVSRGGIIVKYWDDHTGVSCKDEFPTKH